MSQIIISDIVSLRERYESSCWICRAPYLISCRGKYQGIIGGAVALGYAIGPVIGGALSQKVSWRVRLLRLVPGDLFKTTNLMLQWCFWIDVPISLSAMCVIFFVLPLKPVEGGIRR